MTLKITRYFTDAFKKQAKISHWAAPIKVDTPDKIRGSFKQLIQDQFGELFLNDANYVIVTEFDKNSSNYQGDQKRFVKLVSQVLDTDVARSEVKILDSSAGKEVEEDDEDEAADDVKEPDVVLAFIKITTK